MRSFELPSPPRLVLDMPVLRWRAALPEASASRYIKQIRYARYNATTSRVVFDLRRSVKYRVEALDNGRRIRIALNTTGRVTTTETVKPITLKGDGPNPETLEEDEPAPLPPAKKPLIMIDAGHGGKDPGCIAVGKAHEKNITLDYARALKKALIATGRYRAALTRDTDKFIPLRGRVDIARKAKADIFLSLHADTAPGSDARGLSIYTLSLNGGDKEANKLAARENKADIIDGVDLSGASEDVADILIDFAMHGAMDKSREMASHILKGMKTKNVTLLSNPQREAGFAVLKAPDLASALIELGFLSNRKEEKLLQTRAHKEKIIAGIVRGIDSYLKQAKP